LSIWFSLFFQSGFTSPIKICLTVEGIKSILIIFVYCCASGLQSCAVPFPRRPAGA
jgi:hypothetical protein